MFARVSPLTEYSSSVPSSPETHFTVQRCSQQQAYEYFYEGSVLEGWNPGAQGHDIRDVFYGLDPKGWFYGKLSIPGEPDKVVSIISAVRYGEDQGWIGYYLADPAYRGRGYGMKGFQAALEHLKGCRQIGLDGLMAQVENYKKSGFVHNSWENERRHGSVVDLVETGERQLAQQIRENQSAYRLVRLNEVPVNKMVELEERFTAAMEGDELIGFGCVRQSESSYRLGPLYSTKADAAKEILVKLAVDVVDADKNTDRDKSVPLYFDMDVPISNNAVVEMLDKYGWKNISSSVRMWKGEAPKVDVDGVFAINTLEIG
ncbi:hypothetical protein BGW38_002693 [Lunasporangiospora selenospora]|uniref:N-acetyltransferase domain-containing protein n=1 Tax=Lunasporangiospora selenospora TaxID=979761 RepID=A0A9P6FSE1_9FUNG|nr:hypothetical protein BGW38_002693 [Lunasporangiospora selenospora]